MPGIFALIDENKKASIFAEEVSKRLSHNAEWFDVKIFEIQNGFQGVVDFRSNLQHNYITSADNEIQVVVFGEIYLMHSLEINNPPSNNSARIVLSLYERHSIELFKYLNGSFCISIYDNRSKQLIIANDRFGSKPLYYDTRSKGLTISSEIKGVLVPSSSLEYEKNSIVEFFTFSHPLGNKTFFKGIELLPPANILIYDYITNNTHSSSYWTFECNDNASSLTCESDSLETLVQRFSSLMINSIEQRIGDKQHIGIFLSGGIDSRIIAGYAKEIADRTNKHLYSFTFGTKNCIQKRTAYKIAKELNIEQNFYEIPSDTIAKYAQEVVYKGDGHLRIRDAHFIALLEAIQSKVDIVLAGWTADQIFGRHLKKKLFSIKSKAELVEYMFNMLKINPVFDNLSQILVNTFISDFELIAKESFKASVDGIPYEAFHKIIHYWDRHQSTRRYAVPFSNYVNWYVPCVKPFIDNDIADFAFNLPLDLLIDKTFLRKVLKIRFPKLNDITLEHGVSPTASRLEKFLYLLYRYIRRRLAHSKIRCSNRYCRKRFFKRLGMVFCRHYRRHYY